MSRDGVLVDNDVVFKLCAYARHRLLVDGASWSPAFMLPVGRFVLRDLVRKSRRVRDREGITAAVEEAIAGLEVLSPSDAAIALAAEMEEAANAKALELDPGESQLLAVLLLDGARLLLTGDKRAVAAIEALGRDGAEGRIGSLEHVLSTLLEIEEVDELRHAVCAEPEVDAAATACFACHSQKTTRTDVKAGLESYLRALSKVAPTVMCEQAKLAEP